MPDSKALALEFSETTTSSSRSDSATGDRRVLTPLESEMLALLKQARVWVAMVANTTNESNRVNGGRMISAMDAAIDKATGAA